MQFKKWLKIQEYSRDQDKSARLQMCKNTRKPDWAPRKEILAMKKK